MVSELTPDGVKLGMLKLTSNILEEIKNGQKEDLKLVDRVVLVNQGKGVDFRLDENGVLMFRDRVCVLVCPWRGWLRSTLSILLGCTIFLLVLCQIGIRGLLLSFGRVCKLLWELS